MTSFIEAATKRWLESEEGKKDAERRAALKDLGERLWAEMQANGKFNPNTGIGRVGVPFSHRLPVGGEHEFVLSQIPECGLKLTLDPIYFETNRGDVFVWYSTKPLLLVDTTPQDDNDTP